MYFSYVKKATLFILLIILYSSCEKNETESDLIIYETNDFPEEATDMVSINKILVDMDLSDDFELFKSTLDTVMYGERIYYLLEGDLRYDEVKLYQYFNRYINKQQEEQNLWYEPKLVIGLNDDETRDIMPDPKKLTYAVMESSFPLKFQYYKVVKNFRIAASEWADSLNYAIRLTHKNEYDTISNKDTLRKKVSFVIKYNEYDKKQLVATAFFPSDSKDLWNIDVRPKYFITKYDEVGVFRHEIGHILGFRHEHSRDLAPQSCSKKYGSENHTIDTLTDYDKMSVMHYFCEDGFGNRKLSFTDRDIKGALRIYK